MSNSDIEKRFEIAIYKSRVMNEILTDAIDDAADTYDLDALHEIIDDMIAVTRATTIDAMFNAYKSLDTPETRNRIMLRAMKIDN